MRTFIGITLLLGVTTTALAANTESRTSWFKPFLIENNDSACASLLGDAQQKFLSETSYNEAYGVQGHGYLESGTILDWEIQGGNESGVITVYGKTFYLDSLRHPGCGGACERYQPLVSDKPFPDESDYAYREELAATAPPAESYDYTIARRSADEVYLFVVDTTGNKISIYRLAKEGRWQTACKISTAPKDMAKAAPMLDNTVGDTLQKMQFRVLGLMQGAGDCGSMSTHWRWQGDVHNALQAVLYRPWALHERDNGRDPTGNFKNDMAALRQWSLLGIDEYHAFQAFQEQLSETTQKLATFYQKANDWSQEFATKMADDALKGAVSKGIRFYMYDPEFAEGEEALRTAILKKRKMTDIRAIKFDAKHIDAQLSQWGADPTAHESILSIAVDYPEALDFLLRSGVANDHVNDFGKTPLMYAVQNNQIEAAKLLIKAGADVNAVTTNPYDTCYYTLQTFNVTPLHYAVRNASAETVKLLLDSGAQPFINAENHHKYPMVREYPLDWLHRYTATDSKERNPNIPDEQIREIEKWLALPTEQQATELANNYVRKAESSYKKGDVARAYREISLAVQLQADNQSALSDLSLIALKNDKLGESLSASRKLLESQADDKTKANAWFNQGLACENYRAKNQYGFLNFNGNMYCTYGTLHPYVKAYTSAPTDGRKNKMKKLFGEHLVPYCEISTGGKNIKISFQAGTNPDSAKRGQLQTLYVLHGKSENVTGADLAWDAKFYGGETQHIVPARTVSIELDDKVMSVFETSESFVQFPYKVFGAICTQKESMELPRNNR